MSSERQPRRVIEALAVFCAASICILFFYRAFFLWHFNQITGDPGDARLCVVLLEHWRAVLTGHASFASPNFFAPAKGVLGYSESLFLYAPAFLLLRAAGADPYLSFQVTLIIVRLIGFFALYALLRKKLRFQLIPSLAGASLFSVAHVTYYSSGHPQLAAVGFVPLIALLGFHYFERPAGRAWSLWSASALFGLLFFTGYYIAFFCVLAAGAAIVCWWVLRALEHRPAPVLPKKFARDGAIALAVFLAALAPMIAVYLPVLRQTGGRPFAEIEAFFQSSRALLDVSSTNIVWGKAMSWLYRSPVFHHGETSLGFTPGSVLLAAAGMYWAVRGWRRGALRTGLMITGLVCAVLYAISSTYIRWTPWWLVFHFVPGGSAIRVPSRINILIELGIAVLCAAALQRILDWSRKPGGRRGMVIAAAITGFLFVEQGDSLPQMNINRASEMAFLEDVPAPPAGCVAFFLVDPRIPHPDLIGQIDAMLIAREKGIPTLDGYSGWWPPGWTLSSLAGDVSTEAQHYAERTGIRSGLCQFDEGAMSWNRVAER